VLQKIAVVGSPGTSGHTDFLKQLEKNEYAYKFNVQNFPCQVQGDKAAKEIIQKLSELSDSHFDVIVVIRGGGSKLDLEVFNSYEIAKTIALHAKPILTGIGHETDISIADIVANQYFKTPSALGAFIVSRNHNYEIGILNSYAKISSFYDSYLQRQKYRVKQCLTEFRTVSVSFTQLRRGELHKTGNRISAIIKDKLAKENQFQRLAKQTIRNSTHSSIHNRKTHLAETTNLISLRTKQAIRIKDDKLKFSRELAQHCVKNRLSKEQNFLINCEQLVRLYHPDNVLERGYTITRLDGKIIEKTEKINEGSKIEVETIDKIMTATVISVRQKVSKWKTLLTKVLQKS
jgi:exodeoxyribonuclease VII large subunit